jgi:hypothetical protein
MNSDIIKCVVCNEDVDYDLSVRVKEPDGDACRDCSEGLMVADLLIKTFWGKKSKPLRSDRK